jgi:hypothetical protein
MRPVARLAESKRSELTASFGLIPTPWEFKMLYDAVQVVEVGSKSRRLLARTNQNALRFKD